MPDLGLLASIYNEQTLSLTGHKSSEATYTDADGGEQIVLEGSNLAYVLAKDQMTSGHVDTIVFEDKHGHAMVTMTAGDFSAKDLSKLLTSTNGVELFLDTIRSGKDTFTGTSGNDDLPSGMGNDVIKGGAGNDILDGGRYDDRLTGGNGSDHFAFGAYYDKDVVTDFDANGGGTHQDYVDANWADVVSIKQSGDNTVLNFGAGDTLTLLHVNHGDISKADFDITF
jgi:Ca2+-binding RTX toxin-like protein